MSFIKLFVNLLSPSKAAPAEVIAPLESVDLTRWAPPRRPPERKGKRKTPEELEAERSSLAAHMHDLAEKRISRDFSRAQAAGITHYRWRSCGLNGGACAACLSREGKKFRLDSRPDHGHPGEGTCGERGFCRCYPEMIIPGFK